MEDQFPCECSVALRICLGFGTTTEEEFHSRMDVFLQFFSPFAPDFRGDPVGEFPVADLPAGREADVEN